MTFTVTLLSADGQEVEVKGVAEIAAVELDGRGAIELRGPGAPLHRVLTANTKIARVEIQE